MNRVMLIMGILAGAVPAVVAVQQLTTTFNVHSDSIPPESHGEGVGMQFIPSHISEVVEFPDPRYPVRFSLENTAFLPQEISLSASCGCVNIHPKQLLLPPGERVLISAEFDLSRRFSYSGIVKNQQRFRITATSKRADIDLNLDFDVDCPLYFERSPWTVRCKPGVESSPVSIEIPFHVRQGFNVTSAVVAGELSGADELRAEVAMIQDGNGLLRFQMPSNAVPPGGHRRTVGRMQLECPNENKLEIEFPILLEAESAFIITQQSPRVQVVEVGKTFAYSLTISSRYGRKISDLSIKATSTRESTVKTEMSKSELFENSRKLVVQGSALEVGLGRHLIHIMVTDSDGYCESIEHAVPLRVKE